MQVHAYSSWGTPDYFYDYAQGLLDGLQASLKARDILDIKDVYTYIIIVIVTFFLYHRGLKYMFLIGPRPRICYKYKRGANFFERDC